MSSGTTESGPVPHRVSIVVPVYRGETTLPALLEEILPLTEVVLTPAGEQWLVTEVVLVFDHGPDGSDHVIRDLASAYPFVRPVWLSRNFGQHSATIAGMASSGSEWIATIDEDGQHDPAAIGTMIDAALREGAPLVYGRPVDRAHHGVLRNTASTAAKRLVARLTGNPAIADFQSFRLILGALGRSVAAYAGAEVYLDVALGWVAPRYALADVELRPGSGRRSGYTFTSLAAHFWRLTLSSGTRGLRLVSATGAVLAVAGVVLAIGIGLQRLADGSLPPGWTSIMTVILTGTGLILISLGIIAEYIGVAVSMAMGRPPYLIVSDPRDGPLGRSTTSS